MGTQDAQGLDLGEIHQLIVRRYSEAGTLIDTPTAKARGILELTTALSSCLYLGLTLLCPIRAY
ncbi:MAG: hypothetical protein ACRC62_34025 [Microcoleus sp.]